MRFYGPGSIVVVVEMFPALGQSLFRHLPQEQYMVCLISRKHLSYWHNRERN